MVRNQFSENKLSFALMPGSSQEALRVKLGTISLAAQSKLEEDTAKKEAKAEAKADVARKKKLVRPRSHRATIYLTHLSFPRPLK